MELAKAIAHLASRFIGVRETSRNRGPEVDAFLLAVGLNPASGSYAWCAAFAWYIVDRACSEIGVPNPLPRTASVHRMWRKTEGLRATTPGPGRLYLHDAGEGKGHVGICVDVIVGTPGFIIGVEGNTNPAGSREGDGVYQRERPFSYASLGYIDVSSGLQRK